MAGDEMSSTLVEGKGEQDLKSKKVIRPKGNKI